MTAQTDKARELAALSVYAEFGPLAVGVRSVVDAVDGWVAA
jgi:hypothetical protein